MYCGDCGKECEIIAGDNGFDYEYQGVRGYKAEPFICSDCCDAAVYYDEELTREYSYEDAEEDSKSAAAEARYDALKDDNRHG